MEETLSVITRWSVGDRCWGVIRDQSAGLLLGEFVVVGRKLTEGPGADGGGLVALVEYRVRPASGKGQFGFGWVNEQYTGATAKEARDAIVAEVRAKAPTAEVPSMLMMLPSDIYDIAE